MIRGPKVKMTLHRYTEVKDGGGSYTKTWADVRVIKGVLTFIWADERVKADRETLQNRYHFWFSYIKGLNLTTKDEFSRVGTSYRYRVIYSDDVLEQNRLVKVDLVQTR